MDSYSIRRKDRRGMKERTMMLAAVETVADADTVRLTRCLEADVSAQASTGRSSHARAPTTLMIRAA